MCEPRYLILTKQSDGTDVENWGMKPGNVGLTVSSNGEVHAIAGWDSLPEEARQILVLNMAANYLTVRMKTHAEKIARIVGESPRVWVHFGSLNSSDANVEALCRLWSEKVYDPFRRFTKQPMPYSQAAPAEFDAYVKELSGQIKTALDNNQQADPGSEVMTAVLNSLNTAWGAATQKFPEKEMQHEMQVSGYLRIAQDLMPVFIYLDGLSYASENAPDKREAMAKVVREGVPEALEAVSEEAASCRADDIKKWKGTFSDIGGDDVDSLVTKGQEFCKWYRELIGKPVPESAAKDEPTQ